MRKQRSGSPEIRKKNALLQRKSDAAVPHPATGPAQHNAGSFSPIDSANLGEHIYRRICIALVSGALLPNNRLKIRDLASQMGTSVTPVRDAILRLVQEGALVARSPRDVRVPMLKVEQYLEIRTIRIHLEGLAAAEAAHKARQADIKFLQDLIAENEAAMLGGDLGAIAERNQRFHFALVDIAGMPILRDVLMGLWLRMGPLIAAAYRPVETATVRHHHDVLEAIRSGDALAASNAIQADIINGASWILSSNLLDKD